MEWVDGYERIANDNSVIRLTSSQYGPFKDRTDDRNNFYRQLGSTKKTTKNVHAAAPTSIGSIRNSFMCMLIRNSNVVSIPSTLWCPVM